MKFESLYSFIEDNFHHRDHADPHKLVKKFANSYGLDSDRIIKILKGFGGHNDFEVVLNVPDRIPGEVDIEENIETPEEFAIKNNLYCKWKDGKWVECEKSDDNSMPDLNRAHVIMETKV